MFEGGYSVRGSYQRAFVLWRELAARNGFELNTWDMRPLKEADVIWFIDLPHRRKDFLAARRRAPQAAAILMICESPILGPHFFHKANQALFDYVATYESVTGGGETRLFQYFLPLTGSAPTQNPPFAKRKVLCMINTNRVEGYPAVRQTGWNGLPVFGKLLSGWRVDLDYLVAPTRGDLYEERRRLARAADEFAADGFDFFGSGWNGEQISWCPLYRNKPYRCFRKSFVEDKIGALANYRFTLAFENWRGGRLYITDKLFDGFLSGSVPVYLGEERIADFVPRAAFVDARQFRTRRELLLYLKSCPEPEWLAMREAGQQFLNSEAFKPFSDEAFAERMTGILKQLIPKHNELP